MPGLRARYGLILSLVAAGAALPACDNSQPPSASLPAPRPPAVALDTPEQAARSVLTGLQAELHAVAHDDQESSAAALKELRSIVDAEAIQRRLARAPRFGGLLGGKDQVEGYIQNWGSMIAYYAEGFRFERMRRVADTSATARLVVPASGPEDDALIEVTCLRQDDATWRVSRIEFGSPTTSSTPATQPLSPPPSEP